MASEITILDHTGDIGIEIRADSAAEIFSAAATALFDVLTVPEKIKPAVEESIDLADDGYDLLLRNFLSELLYRFSSNRMAYSRFTIETLGEQRLVAKIAGEPFDLDRHGLRTELKAVTYHQLEMRRDGERWFARVIFDI